LIASPVDAELAEIVWSGTASLRVRAHAAAGDTRCRTRIAPYSDNLGATPHQACRDTGCLGIMHEIYARTASRLFQSGERNSHIANRLAYARRIVATQIADFDRERRVARGLPARPTRNDGIAGRINQAMDSICSDSEASTWLTTLFRMIRGYVCRDNRSSGAWPLDIWAGEKSRIDGCMRLVGSASARAEITADIRQVLAIAEKVAGRSWVNASILHPLLTYTTPLTGAVCDTVTARQPHPVELISADDLRQRFWTLVSGGLDAQSSWVRAARDVMGRDPVSDVTDILDDLLPATKWSTPAARAR
jgi:hypothetical protein